MLSTIVFQPRPVRQTNFGYGTGMFHLDLSALFGGSVVLKAGCCFRERPQFAPSALTGFRDFMGEGLLTILVPAAWVKRRCNTIVDRGCLAFDWHSPGHFGSAFFVVMMLHMGTYGPKSCCRLLAASVTVARAYWYDFPFSQCTGAFLHFARWLLQCWTGARLLRKGSNNQ